MGSLIQPTPVAQEPDNSRRIIVVATAAVVVVALIIAFLLRQQPKAPLQIPPYAAQLKISGLKMSQAQNFVGASVTYIDGTITNSADKTVTRAVVRVTFRDPYGQIAQIEDVPIRILQTSGPYPDTAELAAVPLAPGQTMPFRLIFEHISEQWSQGYPEMQIVEVTTK
ncbi:MAG TPA: DUF2393 family protein [Terriglobales bacterium]|nr:DUF2393 family protein [Terriglobales bacterium]